MITLKRLQSADGVVDIDLNPTGGAFATTAEVNTLRGRVAGVTPASLARSGRWPEFTGVTLGVRDITVRHDVTEAGLEANLQLLEGVVYSQRHGVLLLTFEEEGVDKTGYCLPYDLVVHPDNSGGPCADTGRYQGTWQLYDQTYYALDATETPATPTTGDSTIVSVDVAGTVHSERAVFTLTPTGQKAAGDGQQWRIPLTVVNVTPRPVVHQPVELTDWGTGASLSNGIDHAALVTGGDSLASGDDIEAYRQLRRTDRWTFPTDRTWDEADTGIVSNLDLPPRRTYTLAANVADSDLTLTVAGAGRRDLANLPEPLPFFLARVNSASQEVLKVTDVDSLTGVLTVERGARGTTAQAMTAGDVLYWADRSGHADLVGGYTGATPPATNDDEKPCILDVDGASSNAQFVWPEFYETGISGDTQRRKDRSASWFSRGLGKLDREKKTGEGDMYWRYIASAISDPATTLGIVYRMDGAVAGRPLIDRWEWMNPIAFDKIVLSAAITVDMDGNEARLYVYVYDEDGNEILVGTYDDVTLSGEAITLDPPAIGVSLRIGPFVPKVDSTPSVVPLEPADGKGFSVTAFSVEFVTAQQIVVIPGGQEDVYQFGRPDAPATIRNADGDTLNLYGILCPIDADLVIDVEGRSVTVDGEPATHLVRGTFPALPPRTDVFPTPGSTALVYDETDAGAVDIAVSHKDAWN